MVAFQEEREGGLPRELLMSRRETLSLLSQRPEAGEGEEEMRKMKVAMESRLGKGEAMAGSVALFVFLKKHFQLSSTLIDWSHLSTCIIAYPVKFVWMHVMKEWRLIMLGMIEWILTCDWKVWHLKVKVLILCSI